VGPAAVEAGRSGVGFLQALARRHGTGLFYAVLAFLTVIAGLWTYFANGIYQSASASNLWATLAVNLWATLAVGLAIVALLLGASANRIAERKWVNAVKNANESTTTEQVAAVLAKAEQTNVITTIVLGLALVCVVWSRIMA